MDEKQEAGTLPKMPITGLDPYELACLSARVPVSGNPRIDKLIAVSMKMDIAKYALQALITGVPPEPEAAAQLAVEYADALVAKFFKASV